MKLPLQYLNLPTLKRKNNNLLNTAFREKWLKKNSNLKPFKFCCSLDCFDPLSRYDQRKPPYKSSLTAITSVHECPVTKMQIKFSTSRLAREKKRPAKTRISDAREQQQPLKNSRLNYFQSRKNNRFIRQHLEDKIALAKDIFWAKKKRIYKEASNKAIKIAKKKSQKYLLKLMNYPRWYQDFSPDQMKHLMKLENVMLTDYEETKTNGTQTTLIAIGITSTLFKLNPSTIKKLYKSCKLNSVDFLREIYRILTGNDFCEEGYKNIYNCNERIILSAIAFLTLPETVKELHKRLPAVTMPRLPSKPKLTYLERRKDICPYKEELFKRPDWAGYRNALQEWRKHYKLTAIPKIIPLNNKYGQVFIDNRSDVKNRRKDISTEHLKEIGTKELQKISSTMYDCQKGPPKPPGADIKSWLRKKDPHYMIAGVSTENDYPITYEIAGVANVTPINSDEKFFATLKLDDYTKKVFPSGRENLSISWQEWLQNADESYKQLEEKTDEIMKSVQAIMKSMLPAPFCDSCCSCRQTRKFEEQLQQSKALIDGEKNIHIIDSMQSSGENPTELPINQVPEDEIRTDIIQPIKNVPPCSCVHSIQQMANKDISLSISKENIPWTKEGLCPGMKYRPKEPGYIQPAVLSEELLAISQRIPEKKTEKIDDEEETRGTKKEPCCWRTKSEQELPAKKTVAYLCEPDYPLETMAVRPGGQLCQCRVTYNISGLVERKTIRKKLNEEDRIIDGILYVTPPISPRRSDEYIPEYDLFKSPYDMCVSEAVDNRLKLLEKYSGPKSLIEKLRKKPKSCNCCNDVVIKEDYLIDQKKDFEETRKKFMESKSPEERWKTALKDTALTDYFTRRDNTSGPCWTTCKKIARSYRPCRLKVVKPVCECKYERKIVERNEERMEWKTRQQRLKNLKKQSFVHIVGISRPVIEDKIIIPDVKKIPREDEKDDVEYCISDVTEDVFMSPPQKIIDGLKMSSPFQTPSSSVEDILRTTVLRHLSPTNIPSCPLSRKDAVLKEEMEHTKKEDEALKIIYKYKDKQDTSYLMIHNYQDELIKKVDKRILNKENHINIKKKTSKEIEGLQSLNKKTDSKIEHRRGVPYKETTGKIIHKNKYSKEIINEIDQQNVSHKQIEKTEEKIDDKSHRMSGGGDKKYKKFDQLIAIMKVELKKMAAEGYIFAKLPKCYLMPQLQDWVMYRQGVVFSETDKKNLMRETRIMWDVTSRKMVMEFEKPSLHMTRHQLKRLTFDQAERLKKKRMENCNVFWYYTVKLNCVPTSTLHSGTQCNVSVSYLENSQCESYISSMLGSFGATLNSSRETNVRIRERSLLLAYLDHPIAASVHGSAPQQLNAECELSVKAQQACLNTTGTSNRHRE
ncbi:PREDICTED: uncharacterized protein LOC105151234 [Acromyrmex echinatior]|uniref:uncharacterized protein LOC105151234 n=1 Tax=Acromyrmex echinatior TaxID=103372 RepID=UPI0005810D42|nr:PREDICTED: uncharacterized protein LOC105151234 [Acromyrmex echinatior]